MLCNNGSIEYWKIVYCVQKPRAYVAVCQLHSTEDFAPARLPADASPQDIVASSFDYAFRCNYGVMSTAADMPPVSQDQLSVIFGLKHVGGVIVTAHGPPLPLRGFLCGTVTPEYCVPKPPKEVILDKEFEGLVLQMPWLQHLDSSDSFITNAEKAAGKSSSASSSAPLVAIEVDEDEIFAGLASVEKARMAESAVATEAGHVDFVCHEKYGESNLLKGKPFHDAVQGHCGTKEATSWARDRGLQITFKATFTAHDPDPSRVLVRAWCHRMQYFFDHEKANGGYPGFAFSDDVVKTYREPDELSRVETTCTKPANTLPRIAAIRRLPLR